jgi:hypothetical protein
MRRFFLGAATLLLAAGALCVPADLALAQQVPDKPQVKLSDVRPAVMELVENISRSSGRTFSLEQKTRMANLILAEMQAHGICTLIEP